MKKLKRNVLMIIAALAFFAMLGENENASLLCEVIRDFVCLAIFAGCTLGLAKMGVFEKSNAKEDEI